VTPSTDPDERNYRIRLLPRVTTPMRQRHRHRQTYLLQLSSRLRKKRVFERIPDLALRFQRPANTERELND